MINETTMDQRVNIGGFSLHIHCTGMNNHNGPTVVLDSALGLPGRSWILVQREVEKFARVCSYDRAGYGLSDSSPNPRTSKSMAEELHSLLKKSKIDGPYLLVGNSLGGINIMTFAALYPNDVYGLILADSSHPDQYDLLASIPSPKQSMRNKVIQFFRDHSTYIDYLFDRYETNKRPKPKLFLEDEWQKQLSLKRSYKYFNATSAELKLFNDSLLALKKMNLNINDKPLVIITAGKIYEPPGGDPEYIKAYNELQQKWILLQKQFTKLSTNCKHIIAENSGHLIPEDEPEIIIKTIKEIIPSRST